MHRRQDSSRFRTRKFEDIDFTYAIVVLECLSDVFPAPIDFFAEHGPQFADIDIYDDGQEWPWPVSSPPMRTL